MNDMKSNKCSEESEDKKEYISAFNGEFDYNPSETDDEELCPNDWIAITKEEEDNKKKRMLQQSRFVHILQHGYLNCWYDNNIDYAKRNETNFLCYCTSSAQSYHFPNSTDGYNMTYFTVFTLLSLGNMNQFKKELQQMGQNLLRDLLSFTDAPKNYSYDNNKKRELLLQWYKQKLNLN